MLLWRRSLPDPFHRGCFVAWGFSNGTWSPSQFADKAAEHGYAWAALELDDYGGLDVWPEFKSACHNKGIRAGGWVTEGGNIFIAPDDSDFIIAELESENDYQGVLTACAVISELPPVPRAVVTNFTPLTTSMGIPIPDKAAPLIENSFHCLTECYLGDNPNATPEKLDFRARQLGWNDSQPVFGVYNFPLSGYDQWKDWPGASDYLAENVL